MIDLRTVSDFSLGGAIPTQSTPVANNGKVFNYMVYIGLALTIVFIFRAIIFNLKLNGPHQRRGRHYKTHLNPDFVPPAKSKVQNEAEDGYLIDDKPLHPESKPKV